MKLDIETRHFSSACDEFYAANHGLSRAMTALSDALASGGAMAGDDSGGRAWSEQYDAAAPSMLTGASQLATGMGVIGNLLNASLTNHRAANRGAVLPGFGPYLPGADGDTNPTHYAVDARTTEPPTAFGGSDGEPDGWHWIAEHLEGLLWPTADTDRLREVGSAWRTAGTAFDTHRWDVSTARCSLEMLRSPEIPLAIDTCTTIEGHCGDFSTACADLASACDDYAQHVEDHRAEIIGVLKELVAWTVADQVAGAALAFFTAGGSEVAAQVAEVGLIAKYAAKVVAILRRLVELARVVATTIETALATVKNALLWLPRLLKAKVVEAFAKASVRAAVEAAEKERAELLRQLTAQGIKHSPDDVVRIFKTADGKIIFLEKGRGGERGAGLAHILEQHADDFARRGIPASDIPAYLEGALTNGTLVGTQGSRPPLREVFELVWEGVRQRVAISVGKNGFIVGANPTKMM